MMDGIISGKTLIPLSLVIIAIVVTVHFTSVRSLANSNHEAVGELKVSRSKLDDRILAVEKLLYKIDGKLDLLLKK